MTPPNHFQAFSASTDIKHLIKCIFKLTSAWFDYLTFIVQKHLCLELNIYKFINSGIDKSRIPSTLTYEYQVKGRIFNLVFITFV